MNGDRELDRLGAQWADVHNRLDKVRDDDTLQEMEGMLEELELQVCQRKADSLAGVKVKLSIASSLASTYDSEGCLVRMLNSALRDCRAIQTSN